MDINKLFSIQSNGYSIGEVDDYVTFIQTELTKNMKVNRDLQNKNDSLFDSLNQIKSDNRKLSEKNQKLYKDCVAFAKRLKALEVYDNSVETTNNIENEQLKSLEELQNSYDILLNENQELKAKLYNATYATPTTSDEFYVVNDDINKKSNHIDSSEEIETQEFVEENSDNNEILESVFDDTQTQENQNLQESEIPKENTVNDENEEEHRKLKIDMDAYNESLEDDDEDENDKKEKEKKVKSTNHKTPQNIKSGKNNSKVSLKIFSFFINLLLTLSIILGVVSVITFAFVKNPEVNFVGYRFYTVLEDNNDLGYNQNDILIVKRIAPAEVRKDFTVLCKNNTSRNIKLISSVKNNDKRLNFYVKDNSKSATETEINSSELIGKITSRIPGIGVISRYAFNNPYDYIAIVSCVLLLCIFIKILMSLRKSKQRKIKFDDYDVSDFSLDI